MLNFLFNTFLMKMLLSWRKFRLLAKQISVQKIVNKKLQFFFSNANKSNLRRFSEVLSPTKMIVWISSFQWCKVDARQMAPTELMNVLVKLPQKIGKFFHIFHIFEGVNRIFSHFIWQILKNQTKIWYICLLYTSPSPRD